MWRQTVVQKWISIDEYTLLLSLFGQKWQQQSLCRQREYGWTPLIYATIKSWEWYVTCKSCRLWWCEARVVSQTATNRWKIFWSFVCRPRETGSRESREQSLKWILFNAHQQKTNFVNIGSNFCSFVKCFNVSSSSNLTKKNYFFHVNEFVMVVKFKLLRIRN